MDWLTVYGHACHTFKGLEHVRWVPLNSALWLAVLGVSVGILIGMVIGYYILRSKLKDERKVMSKNIIAIADHYERWKTNQ